MIIASQDVVPSSIHTISFFAAAAAQLARLAQIEQFTGHILSFILSVHPGVVRSFLGTYSRILCWMSVWTAHHAPHYVFHV